MFEIQGKNLVVNGHVLLSYRAKNVAGAIGNLEAGKEVSPASRIFWTETGGVMAGVERQPDGKILIGNCNDTGVFEGSRDVITSQDVKALLED